MRGNGNKSLTEQLQPNLKISQFHKLFHLNYIVKRTTGKSSTACFEPISFMAARSHNKESVWRLSISLDSKLAIYSHGPIEDLACS